MALKKNDEIKNFLEKDLGFDLQDLSLRTPSFNKDENKFRIPCCCLSQSNAYDYGEPIPERDSFNIDNPKLKEFIEKYPESFLIADCIDCWGCGNW